MNTNSLNSRSLVWITDEPNDGSTMTREVNPSPGLLALAPVDQPTTHPVAPRHFQTRQMQRNLLNMLPVELKLMVAKNLPRASQLDLRVSSKEWVNEVAYVVKEVQVRNSQECIDALRVFSPGGLNEMTFSGDDIADIDLAHLPSRLQIVSLLNCNRISESGIANLVALRRLTELHFDNCLGITDTCLAELPRMSQLICVCLFYCELVTNAGLVHLTKLPKLKELNLGGCDKITDAGLSHIAAMVQLESLDLTACESITDDGLAHLVSLSKLQSLDLTGCERVGDVGLQHLCDLTQLRELNLCRCGISDQGLANLQPLTKLKHLRLDGCDEITDVGVDHLLAFPNLRSVNLTDCEWVTDNAINRLNQKGVHVEY